jgi:ketol-acid reductoisomerase
MIGYGTQGRALAQNLRDSGKSVVIGLRSRSRSRTVARKDGFERVVSIKQAVLQSAIIAFAFPDHEHGTTFEAEILPFLQPGTTLWFLHGLSVHFGFVKPPSNCDLILIAPHAPGSAVREKYLSDRSVSAFYAIQQNATGKAEKTALALARAAGFKRKNLVRTSFEHEALGDLFSEQAVLCGGLTGLIKNGFETLVENGIPPENAYLEVAYQLDLIVELVKRHGINGMFDRISTTARYGSAENGPKIIDSGVKKRMGAVFEQIKSGEFTARLCNLKKADLAELDQRLKTLSDPLLEKAARKFRP